MINFLCLIILVCAAEALQNKDIESLKQQMQELKQLIKP